MSKSFVTILALLLAAPAHALQGSAVPKSAQPSAAAQASVDAPWRDATQKAQARVDHGMWTAQDIADPQLRAVAAVTAGIGVAVLTSSEVPAGVDATTAAEALLAQGRCSDAIKVLTDLPGTRAASLRAQCFEKMGRRGEALDAGLEALRDLNDGKATTAQEIVCAADAMQVLARVRTTDAAACEAIMKALADAQALERLDWRGRVSQARFLLEKHNAEEAVGALREAVALNPRSAEAWQLLGEVALMGFDFDGAQRASQQIRDAAASVDSAAICAPAILLLAESACLRFDAQEALSLLKPLREAMPQLMDAIALEAAAHALEYDFDAMRASLASADAIAPGSGRAHWRVGKYLALARQYQDAADMFTLAAQREPKWSVPRNELGLLEMQAGHDDRARDALAEAVKLDPFDRRVSFSKYLMDEMASWKTFESPHFRVRCKPGVDEILAASMPAQLEEMYAEVCGRFGHEPSSKTTIELMPDHQHFAVRITGMPQIHTVAASTGPVIALEPPREGGASKSIGRFDWLDTLRHEFVHTVSLDRTSNRIPHWFTEAAAVDLEHKARDWPTYQLLAHALEKGELFDLDGIKWAFVRPAKPSDRHQAYAQGHWMVQFMRQQYGAQALTKLLDRYARGETEAKAFPAVLGIAREQFMSDFTRWAVDEVASWGLSATPSIDDLLAQAKAAQAKGTDPDAPLAIPDAPLEDAAVAAMLDANPKHPDVLEIAARRAVARCGALDATKAPGGVDDAAVVLLERYSKARPLDPWPHERLAARALALNDPSSAREHLAFLDARTDNDPSFATELARLGRELKDSAFAMESAQRATRIDPYNAQLRELAASCAIEAGNLEAARAHILALTMIEPDRAQHRKRLEKIDELISKRAG